MMNIWVLIFWLPAQSCDWEKTNKSMKVSNTKSMSTSSIIILVILVHSPCLSIFWAPLSEGFSCLSTMPRPSLNCYCLLKVRLILSKPRTNCLWLILRQNKKQDLMAKWTGSIWSEFMATTETWLNSRSECQAKRSLLISLKKEWFNMSSVQQMEHSLISFTKHQNSRLISRSLQLWEM